MGNHVDSRARWAAYLQAITKGKTDTELAKESKVHRTVISRQRRGESQPTPAHAAALALACGHPPLEALVAADLLDIEHAKDGLSVESVDFLGRLYGSPIEEGRETNSPRTERAPKPRR